MDSEKAANSTPKPSSAWSHRWTPLLIIIFLGAAAALWEMKYDIATQSYQDQLRMQEDAYKLEQLEREQSVSSGSQHNGEQTFWTIAGQLYGSVNQGHADGHFTTDTQAFFQLIEGYEANGGAVIWSDRVHVYQVADGSLQKYELRVPASEFSSSAPLKPEVATKLFDTLLKDGDLSIGFKMGDALNSFEPSADKKDCRRDVFLKFTFKTKRNQIFTHNFMADFPPGPK